ncbi:bifunctional serine/threonine-protein kinase/formylglycine-generating enzyme family protein [Haliangium ochraceum]|uniref:non-specific serine/threonine protein kinase n=1 Tax=Haliangium ochraceum (strain DSM 14365 / JCM 11303 / SMP-2) TaxID=502025 RepID=D0LPD2_HALO1|nr:bifunctional serine/threonine-protein kinase/formylglycine-generating enzyme family protein [Haliangium ochraceum]ACY13497.1 serine/threonine protein kinase [Haliangium ochraceum DSM 14365]
MIGHTLRGYRVVEELGAGGMGMVYIAKHELIGKQAAVKVLLPEYSRDPSVVRRFFNEARAATQIQHPGIVEVFDFGYHDDGSAFIVMELLRGEPLSERLERMGRLPTGMAQRFVLQIAGALGAAHAAGIVHRDLKPDNIFVVHDPDVTGSERAKVLDFGIAKLAGEMSAEELKTRTGMVVGTPRYMAPEQCRGAREVDHRADLYALGCIFYEMLCGRPPFQEKGIGDLFAAHMFQPPAPPSSIDPEIPPDLEAALLSLLAKEPEQRFPSAAALSKALERPGMDSTSRTRVASGDSPPSERMATAQPTTLGTSAASVAASSHIRQGVRWPWIAAASMALVTGLGVALAFTTNGEPAATSAASTLPRDPPAADKALTNDAADPEESNRWVRITPPTQRLILGISAETAEATEDAIGLRPERQVEAPSATYEIQQHEVTWSELEPWLSDNPEAIVYRPDWVPEAPEARAELAATGIPWDTAYSYCRAIGARLPTEAEWEYAARGSERRFYTWGPERLDIRRTNAYRGEDARIAQVMSGDQDRTPGPTPDALYDMMGNAQEWVADLWRNARPGDNESWVQTADATFRTIRGLPLNQALPASLPREGAAYREALCASLSCFEGSEQALAYQGFRCARDAAR